MKNIKIVVFRHQLEAKQAFFNAVNNIKKISQTTYISPDQLYIKQDACVTQWTSFERWMLDKPDVELNEKVVVELMCDVTDEEYLMLCRDYNVKVGEYE